MVIMKLFLNHSENGYSFHNLPKESTEMLDGIQIGGFVIVSAVVLNAVDTIHSIGISTNAEKIHKIP